LLNVSRVRTEVWKCVFIGVVNEDLAGLNKVLGNLTSRKEIE